MEEISRNVLENMPVMVAVYDVRQTVIWANQSYKDGIGVSLEEIVGQPCHPSREADKTCSDCSVARAIRTGKPAEIALTLPVRGAGANPSGEWLSKAMPLRDDAGKIIGAVETLLDITQQRQAEAASKESDARFNAIFEGSRDAIFIAGSDAKFVYVNQVACALTGYTRKELLRMRIPDLHAPEDRHAFDQFFDRIIQGESVVSNAAILRKDGEKVPTEFSNTAVTIGDTVYMHTIARDITEYRNAYARIEREKTFNQTIIDMSPAFIVLIDSMGKVITMNKAFCAALGYTPEMVQGQNYVQTFVPKADRPALLQIMERHAQMDEATIHINRVLKKNGDTCTVEWHGTPIRKMYRGEDVFLGVGIDITQRQQDEELLKQLLQDQQTIFDHDPAFIIFKDAQNNIIRISNTVAEMTGLPREEIEGRPSSEIYPDMADTYFEDDLEVIRSGKPKKGIIEPLPAADGTTKWLLTDKIPYRNENNEIAGIIVFSTDITKLKEVEVSIRDREEQLEAIFDNSLNAIMVADDAGCYITVNQAAADMFGYSTEQLLEMNVGDLRAINAPDSFERYQQYLQRGQEIGEFDFVHSNGQKRVAQFHAIRVRENFNLSVLSDITESKKAEESLKLNEARLQAVFDGATGVPIQGYDRERRVIFWNSASENTYGYTREEALGQLLEDLIVPQAMRESVVRDIQRWHDKDIPIPAGELTLKRKDGTDIYVFSSHVMITSPRGEKEMFCIDVDISERKQVEERLKAALHEKEILLRELYHRTKNTMQVIRSMLLLQAAKTPENTAVQKLVKDTDNRILAMALVHQKLYQSQDLSRINIQEYIDDLARLILESYSLSPQKISLRLQIQPIRLSLDTAIPCGLVLNELLSNSLRYAFPEGYPGEISIRLFRTDSGQIELHVSDNGVGVPEQFDFRGQDTLGLQTIIGLAEHQMQGRVRFSNDNGIACVVEFSDTLCTERV